MNQYFNKDSDKKVIERFTTPRGEILLLKRGIQYEIIYNGIFLMASYNGDSEGAMIKEALNIIENERNITVLIGGLGVGYSLKSALEFENIERIDVVEIEESIIKWNKTYFKTINKNALNDPKVKILNDDIYNYIIKCDRSYHLIAIDVDNGPDWLVLDTNKKIYDKNTFLIIKEKLQSGGILSIWSATYSIGLMQGLKKVFSSVRFIKSSDGNYIYLASKDINATE